MSSTLSRRPRRGRTFWARMLAEHSASGLSVAAFCAKRDLGRRTFTRWQRKLSGATAAVSPAFVELPGAPVTVAPVSGCWEVELELPDGVRLRIRHG